MKLCVKEVTSSQLVPSKNRKCLWVVFIFTSQVFRLKLQTVTSCYHQGSSNCVSHSEEVDYSAHCTPVWLSYAPSWFELGLTAGGSGCWDESAPLHHDDWAGETDSSLITAVGNTHVMRRSNVKLEERGRDPWRQWEERRSAGPEEQTMERTAGEVKKEGEETGVCVRSAAVAEQQPGHQGEQVEQ